MRGPGRQSRSEGIVQSGATEIAYSCWGQGPAVVLLCAGVVAPELVAAVASRFRVIAPRIPPAFSDAEFGAWLGVLVDGLGLVRPRAVLVGRASVLASIARNETDRLAQVEVVSSAPHVEEVAALLARLSR